MALVEVMQISGGSLTKLFRSAVKKLDAGEGWRIMAPPFPYDDGKGNGGLLWVVELCREKEGRTSDEN